MEPLGISTQTLYCQNLELLGYIFVADILVYLYSNFHGGLQKTHVLKQCIMALQGHARSLILAPIESVYAFSCWSSIVTLVLSCRVSEILQVSSEDPKLIVHVINFEVVQPISHGTSTSQMDGRRQVF